MTWKTIYIWYIFGKDFYFLIISNIMLFNFQSFIEELREKEDKKELIEKYEKFFGPLAWEIKDQIWYKEYLINFKTIPFLVPDELKSEFDRGLLLQLVSSSFSSECYFEKPEVKEWEALPVNEQWEKLRDLTIAVKSWDQSVVKKLSELRSFQILRLYEIYIEEEMNLQVLIKEDEKEAAAILSQRQARLQRRKVMLESLDREEVQAAAKVEQEAQLWNLMDQL